MTTLYVSNQYWCSVEECEDCEGRSPSTGFEPLDFGVPPAPEDVSDRCLCRHHVRSKSYPFCYDSVGGGKKKACRIWPGKSTTTSLISTFPPRKFTPPWWVVHRLFMKVSTEEDHMSYHKIHIKATDTYWNSLFSYIKNLIYKICIIDLQLQLRFVVIHVVCFSFFVIRVSNDILKLNLVGKFSKNG